MQLSNCNRGVEATSHKMTTRNLVRKSFCCICTEAMNFSRSLDHDIQWNINLAVVYVSLTLPFSLLQWPHPQVPLALLLWPHPQVPLSFSISTLRYPSLPFSDPTLRYPSLSFSDPTLRYPSLSFSDPTPRYPCLSPSVTPPSGTPLSPSVTSKLTLVFLWRLFFSFHARPSSEDGQEVLIPSGAQWCRFRRRIRWAAHVYRSDSKK